MRGSRSSPASAPRPTASRAGDREPAGRRQSPLNQVILLQAPGVAQDSGRRPAPCPQRARQPAIPHQRRHPARGRQRLRPGADPRFASSVDLITGALPAQYGLRTAGIIDIQTKSGAFDAGRLGRDLRRQPRHGCSRAPSTAARRAARTTSSPATICRTGSASRTRPRSYNAIHDETQQGHGFAYLETSSIRRARSAASSGPSAASSRSRTCPGQAPAFTVNGSADFNSRQARREPARDQPLRRSLSYLKSAHEFDVQVSRLHALQQRLLPARPALGDLAVQRHLAGRLPPQHRERHPGATAAIKLTTGPYPAQRLHR